ncbi:hypothetical protein [Gracilimonas sp.]|uniref:hypothetical protein n=1 Tax=Gracilimonas sp. TaxID=1974203 RepID=UPI002870BBB6|nr:hypothetical protein [Gracilimonas sp.]
MKKLLIAIAAILSLAVLVNLNLVDEVEADTACDLNIYTQGEKLCYICTTEDSNLQCTADCGDVICTIPD